MEHSPDKIAMQRNNENFCNDRLQMVFKRTFKAVRLKLKKRGKE